MFEMAEAAGFPRQPGRGSLARPRLLARGAIRELPPPGHPSTCPCPPASRTPGNKQGGAGRGAASRNQPFKAAAAPALIHYLRLRGGRKRPPAGQPARPMGASGGGVGRRRRALANARAARAVPAGVAAPA